MILLILREDLLTKPHKKGKRGRKQLVLGRQQKNFEVSSTYDLLARTSSARLLVAWAARNAERPGQRRQNLSKRIQVISDFDDSSARSLTSGQVGT